MPGPGQWQDGWWSGARRVESTNFGPRPEGSQVSLVLLHHISLPPEEFGGPYVEQFFTNRLDPAGHPYFATIADVQVSAHFFLRRDGEVVQFVSGEARAWHAGLSAWQGRGNCNDYSIGIELEGSDSQPFAPQQYLALWPLLQAICGAYPITAMAGHEHVAPGRKTDPGPYFDWRELARRFPGLELPAQVTA
ncbi:1,6-anhydro-N-acetylmuramyl-L-alanine amidase AmpD [Azovibrio restrictus]|uniref:1,6-anhydro-N-acetylmuramyl-L-alanine amidase AmpD n=1 Tax=Azovibrio restrictus TaxID=146938 RepID=UPI0026F19BDB|nr:1,6-anhydro-N-acetylmuramyl-L-alanine amidase AmpD [Azovibrio restrictus]MDD3482186.1 1,6-anhydro-N-acetylmuramyl-L-alanine amidase AmpD [Azovibrio restrictus]